MPLIIANIKASRQSLKSFLFIQVTAFYKKNVFHDFTKYRIYSQEMSISISPVGSLYVSGGYVVEGHDRRPSSQVDVVDVRSGASSRGPSMRHRRRWHAAAGSPTSLFAFGCWLTENSCEVFNAHTRQ